MALLGPACSRPAPGPSPGPADSAAPRRNLLVVTIDTLRADHCSAYGYALPTTPRLDRLASESVRFALAYAPMATTGPSHASMFTGLFPRSHGVMKNGHALDPSFVTLAETLHEAGYQTAAVVSSFALDSKFGLDQGFDVYDDDFPAAGASVQQKKWEGQEVTGGFDRRADATRARAEAWLRDERASGRPFFLWVHFFDPHAPYDPPEPHKSLFAPPAGASALQAAIAAYDGEVHFADHELGALLDALDGLGLRASTIVAVVGDHGEGLGQHDHMEHGLNIYEEAVRVPFVLRAAGLPAGRIEPGPVELVDLAPTLLELVGRAAGGVDGRSLVPLATGHAAPEPERPIYLERRFYEPSSERALKIKGEKLGLRVGRFKYLEAPEEGTQELYDLAADPGELRNRAREEPQRVTAMAGVLKRWRERTRSAPRRDVSPEDEERLKALGYVR